MKPIYLASASPRRKELLKQLIGDNFEITKSNFEEKNNLDRSPYDLAIYNAVGKARDAASSLSKGIIISADTFITFDNKILGKPYTTQTAKQFLKQISSQEIQVLTGYTVLDAETNQEIKDCEKTVVKIAELTEWFIDSYVATGEPLDKAGGFGIQEKWAVLVEKINGCYFNVVGLPLNGLNKALNKLGIDIFEYE